jgi:hypothetical protein
MWSQPGCQHLLSGVAVCASLRCAPSLPSGLGIGICAIHTHVPSIDNSTLNGCRRSSSCHSGRLEIAAAHRPNSCSWPGNHHSPYLPSADNAESSSNVIRAVELEVLVLIGHGELPDEIEMKSLLARERVGAELV